MNSCITRSTLTGVAIAFFVTACQTLPALAQHGDLMFSINPSDSLKIEVGLVDVGVEIEKRSGHLAHEVEMTIIGVSPAEANREPGINALPDLPDTIPLNDLDPTPNLPLPGGKALSFDFVSFLNPDVGPPGGTSGNLFYWDYDANNVGPVWETVPSGHALKLAHDPGELPSAPLTAGEAFVDGSDTDVEGFDLEITGSDGLIHLHIDTFVSGDLGFTAAPEPGIYLAAIETEIEVDSGIASSDPLFLIVGVLDGFNPNLEFEDFIEGAEGWVEENYDVLTGQSQSAVPEPSGLLLVALALIGSSSLRRRRRR